MYKVVSKQRGDGGEKASGESEDVLVGGYSFRSDGKMRVVEKQMSL